MAFLKDTDPQNSITNEELISKKETKNRKGLKKKSSHSDIKQTQFSTSKPSKELENCLKLGYSIVYVCEICQKDFAGPTTLKIHERVHRKEKDDRTEESETKIATKIFVQTIDPQDIVDQCDEIDIKEEKLSSSYKSGQDLYGIDKKVDKIKPLNTKKPFKIKKLFNAESSVKRKNEVQFLGENRHKPSRGKKKCSSWERMHPRSDMQSPFVLLKNHFIL